ncbi:MAG TPA: serine/threonine-protein kinase, partial [candidate division Zixibacteria bacterium]|nr:serine/threonine-protein kinase [candidate division Zixibacteria bacterium]
MPAAPASPTLTQSKITPTLGDYRLISKIGQGGIAEIYKAIQTSLDREVAVKILSSKLSSDPDIVRRFDRESLTIARLNHPNIVHVIDRGFSQGRYYFVMEYVEGASFKEILTTADIPLRTRLEIIVMTLKGLDYAHKNGVVHRDIKPANILIDKHGNAKVADFGIAHIAETPDNEATRSDIVMGTMAYMSPEQKVSSANVDETTDIYAVGVMLYESLVGQKPLGKFKLPSELDPELPTGYDAIIEKALAPIKKDRYQTAVAMKDDLLDLVSTQRNGSAPKPMASVSGVDTIVGSCRYLDTIRENDYGAT